MDGYAVLVDKLVKRYGSTVAVDHLSFTVRTGELFGLLGPNGSGKTTTISCILQLLAYDKGTIEVFGNPMRADAYELKRRIGVVPQEVAVFEELTVRENVDAFCALYVGDRRQRRALVDAAIDFVDLGKFQKNRPKSLSGGMLRRLNIACGIAHRPELIIFDEPTVGVDPQSRNSILEGIERLNAEGATVIYTSHYMEEVEQLCRRIMIVDHGREIASGTIDEMRAMVGVGERIRVEVVSPISDDDALIEELRCRPRVKTVALEGGSVRIECTPGPHNLADVLSVFSAREVELGAVTSEPPSLNDVFLEITGRALRDEG